MTDGARAAPGRRWAARHQRGVRRVSERVVVLDRGHPDLAPYVFEGSAAQMWGCVDGDRTEPEIARDLAEAFEVPVDVVALDVRQFVERLRDLGLVVADRDA